MAIHLLRALVVVGAFCSDTPVKDDKSYVLEWIPYAPIPTSVAQLESDCSSALSDVALSPKIRGQLLLRRGIVRRWLKKEGSGTDLREAAAQLPDDGIAQLEMGRVLILEKSFEEAIAHGQRLRDRDRQDYVGYLLLGEAYLADGKYEEAIRQFTLAEKRNARIPRIYSGRAECYHRVDLWEKSLADAKRAIQLPPILPESVNADLHGICALAYCMTGDYEAALAHAIKARDLDPSSQAFRANLWFCLAMAEKSSSALQVARRHQLEFPTDAYAHAQLAISEADFGRFDIAQKHANESIRLDRENLIAWNALGLIGWAQGDWKLASDSFSHASTLSSNDFDGRVRIAFLWTTCPDESFRNRKGAAALFHVIENQDLWSTYDPRVRLVLACVAAELEDFEEGLRQLNKCKAMLPEKSKLLATIDDLKVLFQQKKPYRTETRREDRKFDLPLLKASLAIPARTPAELRK